VAADRPEGLSFHLTGPGGFAADSQDAFAGIDGKLLYSAAAVVIIILLLTYRSPVLWLLPLLSAGVALFAAQAVIYLLATKADLTVNAQSAGILTVLVFGAGTDYALLLVARYREELRRHEDKHEAMAFALQRSGPAIFASGSTVVAGMLCLLFASMNSTRGLGPVTAIGIVVALLAMLTLLPALLVICGRWVFWPIRPTYGSDDHTETSLWGRIGRRIARKPRRTWVTTTVLLGAAALGMLTLDANGLSNEESFTGTPDSVVGERVVAAHFPAGAGNPLVVVSNANQAAAVRAAMSSTPGIATVAAPRTADGLAYLEGTMTDAVDTQAAKDTVDRVRASVRAVPGADALAGGGTAILLDTARASDRDNKVIIPVVLAVVLLILALLLRALVAPVMLVATVVLSFGAALGISSLLFNQVLGFGGADTSLPLFVFVFLVALGIDYNIFLMTRVHEEAKMHGTRRGALTGVAATGGVITSAGLVLAGTFAVLATMPVVAFAEIGIAVALGVLLDTIIVRSVLVTALNLDIGRYLWWPGKLAQRRDVEPYGDDAPEPEPQRSLAGS
jgi:RND superfamily putative drug exporter